MKTVAINLFGGPNTRKTTTASGLHHFLSKTGDYKYIDVPKEVATDMLMDGKSLDDQLSVSTEQIRRNTRAIGIADIIIRDAHERIGLSGYTEKGSLYNEVEKLVDSADKAHVEVNIFLKRGNIPYNRINRTQTLDESIEVDYKIKAHLAEKEIPFVEVDATIEIEDMVSLVLSEIQRKKELIDIIMIDADGINSPDSSLTNTKP